MKSQCLSALSMTCASPPHCTSPRPFLLVFPNPQLQAQATLLNIPLWAICPLAPLRLYRLFPKPTQPTRPLPLCNQFIPSPSFKFDKKSFFSFLFFKINLLAVLGLPCCARAFSSCSEWELLFVAVRRLLTAVASLVAEHGL